MKDLPSAGTGVFCLSSSTFLTTVLILLVSKLPHTLTIFWIAPDLSDEFPTPNDAVNPTIWKMLYKEYQTINLYFLSTKIKTIHQGDC